MNRAARRREAKRTGKQMEPGQPMTLLKDGNGKLIAPFRIVHQAYTIISKTGVERTKFVQKLQGHKGYK